MSIAPKAWLSAGGGSTARAPIGREADVVRAVAQEKERDQAGGKLHDDDEGERASPAMVLRELGEQRQEDELAGRRARRQHPDDEAAPVMEPARRDGRAEHEGHHARAEADDDAPERHKLPELGHHGRGEHARRHHGDRRDDDRADAEAVDERRGEGGDQAIDRKANGEGGRDVRGAPAEFLLQRPDEDARRAHDAGVRQHHEKGRADDRPAVEDFSRAEGRGEAVRQRQRRGPCGLDGTCCGDRLRHGLLRSIKNQWEARPLAPPWRGEGRGEGPGDWPPRLIPTPLILAFSP